MKAFLILEDGTVFTGTSIGSTRDMISEIVFNTSMTGYLEVLTDPSYAGQAVVMTYPLIGDYGITPDMESRKAWPDGYIVRELSRMPSNFRCEGTIQDFLKEQDIPTEYVDLLSTPLSKLDINSRTLRAFRKYNIYQLEDLLRFIKYNGFEALYQMPGIGTKSIEQLYEKLKDKKILVDQDTCFLFPYLFV